MIRLRPVKAFSIDHQNSLLSQEIQSELLVIGDMKSLRVNFGENVKMKEAHWQRDRNIRDILVHLYEWHQLLLNWEENNKKGLAMPFIPAPYNWKTYGQMNVEFWKKHQSTSYEEAREMLLDSHRKVMELIKNYSNEELFEKKHFSWTGTSNLGSYCVSATSSHYDWAMKKMKAHLKSYRDSQKKG